MECGVEFCKKTTTSQKKWATAKYCSQPCSIKNTSVKVLGVMKSFENGHTPWNKDKKGLQSYMNISGLKLGSIALKGKPRLDMQGSNNFKWVEPIKTNCEYCNKELSLKPNQLRNRTRNFCNRQCWALGTRGKGSPVYKGEQAVSRLRGRIASMPEYREWHATILKRDNYKCILCESRKDLEVDHIKRFLFIANEYSIITLEDARDCAELWDTKNGRTLCKVCHRTTDTYGTNGLRKSLLE